MKNAEPIRISSDPVKEEKTGCQVFLSDEKSSEPENPRFHLFHHHPQTQFVLILKGSVNCILTDRKLLLEEGDVLLLQSGSFHQIRANPKTEYLSILTDPGNQACCRNQNQSQDKSEEKNKEKDKEINTVGNKEQDLLLKSELKQAQDWRVLPKTSQDPLFLHTLSACILSAKKILVCSEQACRNKKAAVEAAGEQALFKQRQILRSLLTALSQMLQSETEPEQRLRQKEKTEIRFLQMVRFMENHLQEPISAREIAESADISIAEAARCFHKTADTTPGQYLMELRLKKAAELLRTTAKPVTEIGSLCGFSDPSYFSACFKKEYQIPPGFWRKSSRKEENQSRQ